MTIGGGDALNLTTFKEKVDFCQSICGVFLNSVFNDATLIAPRLKYLMQVARNTAADSYTAVKRMACNNSRWKVANQSNIEG